MDTKEDIKQDIESPKDLSNNEMLEILKDEISKNNLEIKQEMQDYITSIINDLQKTPKIDNIQPPKTKKIDF